MAETEFSVSLTLRAGYEFDVDFGNGLPPLRMDEPPPLGEEHGPNASRVLAAALGNCLSASLLYCLRRARIEVQALRTTVAGTHTRNAQGRLRLGRFRVTLEPDYGDLPPERVARCLEIFEDFCTVTQSIRQGITVDVTVGPSATARRHSLRGGPARLPPRSPTPFT